MNKHRDAGWCGEADCRLCTVRASALFAGLDEQRVNELYGDIDDYRLEAGGMVYRAGDPGVAVFTVRSGLVKLVQYLAGGSRRIVRLARGGDVIGLEALLGGAYQHEAVCMEQSSLCRIPLGVLRHLDRDNPELNRELLRRWQRALNEADAWLTELSTGAARQRVARLLLRLVDDAGRGVCQLFGREDMAAMLGITTETASRTIAEFRRRELLQVGPGNAFRCDLAGLEAIAND